MINVVKRLCFSLRYFVNLTFIILLHVFVFDRDNSSSFVHYLIVIKSIFKLGSSFLLVVNHLSFCFEFFFIVTEVYRFVKILFTFIRWLMIWNIYIFVVNFAFSILFFLGEHIHEFWFSFKGLLVFLSDLSFESRLRWFYVGTKLWRTDFHRLLFFLKSIHETCFMFIFLFWIVLDMNIWCCWSIFLIIVGDLWTTISIRIKLFYFYFLLGYFSFTTIFSFTTTGKFWFLLRFLVFFFIYLWSIWCCIWRCIVLLGNMYFLVNWLQSLNFMFIVFHICFLSLCFCIWFFFKEILIWCPSIIKSFKKS